MQISFSESGAFYQYVGQLAAQAQDPDATGLSLLAQNNMEYVQGGGQSCRSLIDRIRLLAETQPQYQQVYQVWSDLIGTDLMPPEDPPELVKLNSGACLHQHGNEDIEKLLERLCSYGNRLTYFNTYMHNAWYFSEIQWITLFDSCRNIRHFSIEVAPFASFVFTNPACQALLQLEYLESVKFKEFSSFDQFCPERPLVNLKRIDFTCCDLKRIDWTKFPAVESLKLGFGSYGSLKGIEGCSLLKRLNLTCWKGSDIEYVGSLLTLEILSLKLLKSVKDVSVWLPQLLNLKTLNLSNSTVAKTGSLASLSSLTTINVDNAFSLSLNSLRSIASCLSMSLSEYINRHKVNLGFIPDLTNYTLTQVKEFIFSLGNDLTYLSLKRLIPLNCTRNISDRDIEEICEHCPNLRHFELDLSDQCTSEIFLHLSRLQFLGTLFLEGGKMTTFSSHGGFNRLTHITIEHCFTLKEVESTEGMNALKSCYFGGAPAKEELLSRLNLPSL